MEFTKRRGNETVKPEFTFVRFAVGGDLQFILFAIFFLMYMFTLLANSFIITIVRTTLSLHSPMYMFIAGLSMLEICYVTVTTPTLLSITLIRNNRISIEGCMSQFYVFISLGASECLLLAAMAADRYLAICNPLRYSSLMTTRLCLQLMIASALGGFVASIPALVFFVGLPFCRSMEINHFFCDYPAILSLACITTITREKVFFFLPWIIVVICSILILASYVCIVLTIKVSPKTQSKAISTCVSHLMVVMIFYTTVSFIYLRPKANYDLGRDKLVTVVYSVVTPLLNPMIYSLRNKAFQKAVHRCVGNISAVICKSTKL